MQVGLTLREEENNKTEEENDSRPPKRSVIFKCFKFKFLDFLFYCLHQT